MSISIDTRRGTLTFPSSRKEAETWTTGELRNMLFANDPNGEWGVPHKGFVDCTECPSDDEICETCEGDEVLAFEVYDEDLSPEDVPNISEWGPTREDMIEGALQFAQEILEDTLSDLEG